MAEVSRLAGLLDEPEVRVVVFGLAHLNPARPAAAPGAARLREIVLALADLSEPDQYRSWLTDDVSNHPMAVDRVRLAIGEDVINDLAQFAGSTPDAVVWQLATVLPDLVDAMSPGGRILEIDELDRELRAVVEFDDLSAGPFGPQAH